MENDRATKSFKKNVKKERELTYIETGNCLKWAEASRTCVFIKATQWKVLKVACKMFV